ncbi:hypothetical protein [Streptomyces rochei]|uniref:hypothetical protein n=1 Tax=Streptomyces rochei TaxID=1928 RepID=UPI00373EDEAB
MPHIVPTTTASSPLPEQGISANLTVEVMHDLDTGQPTLVAATQGNQGDLQVVTPAQVLAKAAALRKQADQIESLAHEYADKVVIPAFLDEFGIVVEELDMANLATDAPDLAAKFHALSLVMNDGTWLVSVPKEQTPTERLATIRALVLDQQKRGQS